MYLKQQVFVNCLEAWIRTPWPSFPFPPPPLVLTMPFNVVSVITKHIAAKSHFSMQCDLTLFDVRRAL